MCKKNIYRLCNVKRLEQDIKSVAILEWKKWGGALRGHGKSSGGNI